MTAIAFPNLWIPNRLPALCPRCGKVRLRNRFSRWWDRIRDPLGMMHPAAGDVLVGAGGKVIVGTDGKVRVSDGAGNTCCCGGPPTSTGCFFAGCSDCPGSIIASSARATFSGVDLDIGACHFTPFNMCGNGVPVTDSWWKNRSGSLGSYCMPLLTGTCQFASSAAAAIATRDYGGAGQTGCNDIVGLFVDVSPADVQLFRTGPATWELDVVGSIGAFAVWYFHGTANVADCTTSFQVRNVLPGVGQPVSGSPPVKCAPPDSGISMSKGGSALVEFCC